MDIKDVLIKIGYTDLRDFGKEWRTRPLYRSSGNASSLCIKKGTGEWYDFSERIGGGLAQLVQITLGLKTLDEAEKMVGDAVEFPSTATNRYELSSIKKFDKNLLIKLQKDHSYWVNRGISERLVSQFQGGITFNGRMAYRYVFPILDEKDDLLGFSGRSLNNNPDYPKWKHIGAKTNWCYPLKWNADIIAEKKSVILLESIGDMLSLWEAGVKNTIVTFGVDISHKIVEFCLKMDMQKILIGFNNDLENDLVGNRAASEGREKLLRFFDTQQVVIALPEAKDFGEMTPEQISLWQTQYLQN